jgi:adenine-specific DNA-methyltransferase
MNPGIDAQSADKSQKRCAQERPMEKLKLHTPDLTAQNIDKLAQLFPNCVTETRDEQGRITQAIDFDQLRQELSGSIVEGPRERYHLDWPGKRDSILAANAPIAKTLRPYRAESVDFDTTKNLFIEGDNLDALKLLQETYLGKVKLIYIDPPYNTGNDFIYEDDFAEDSEAYLLRSNQKDESGNRMVANTEANGRFHSDWASMIYSRLKLSRNLLREDGVIFISINDVEVATLRLICDEVYGSSNFIATVIWQKVYAPKSSARHFSEDHDYLIVYARNAEIWSPNLLPRTDEQNADYKNPDNDPRGAWKANNLSARNFYSKGTYSIQCPGGRVIEGPPKGRYWAMSKERLEQLDKEGRVWWGNDKNNVPSPKIYISEVKDGRVPQTLWKYDEVGHTQEAKKRLVELMDFEDSASVFDTPKPVRLMLRVLELGTNASDESIAMDFFAGSGTLGDALMQANAKDQGNRRFVLVQLPEPTGEVSYKTIADLSKERVTKAGAKIKSETALTAPNLDTGFRVLKIDTSNMRDVYYAPDAVAQGDLLGQVDNIRQDRTPEDLLFQVLVDQGVDLALPIAEETITGKKVFFVDGNALAACFDFGVTDDLVKEIAKRKPLRAVFRDSSYGNDSVKINVDQIFRLLSPETEVRSL